MKLLFAVVEALESAGASYALIGAAALAARGASGATLGVDLLAVDARVLRKQTWAGLSRAGVRVDLRRGEADDPLAGAVRFEAPGERLVDLMVGRAAWQRRVVDRAEALTLGDRPLRVARTPDLVLLKLSAGGPQAAGDVQQLLTVAAEPGLAEEVERGLPELPAEATALWRRVRPGGA